MFPVWGIYKIIAPNTENYFSVLGAIAFYYSHHEDGDLHVSFLSNFVVLAQHT
jgi:hypothetical protein